MHGLWSSGCGQTHSRIIVHNNNSSSNNNNNTSPFPARLPFFCVQTQKTTLGCRPWLASTAQPLEGGSDVSGSSVATERLSVAIALAESQHHTSRGQKMARPGRSGTRSTTRYGHRSGSSGKLWSTLSTSCALLQRCEFSMHL